MLAKRASPEAPALQITCQMRKRKNHLSLSCHFTKLRLRSGPPEPNFEMLSKSLTLNHPQLLPPPLCPKNHPRLTTVALGRFVVRWPLCILRLHGDLNEISDETTQQNIKLMKSLGARTRLLSTIKRQNDARKITLVKIKKSCRKSHPDGARRLGRM